MVNNYVRMIFALLALNGCSLSSSDGDPSLHLDLSSLQERRFSLLNGGGFINSLIGTPPAAATGFACYGVNVTGPGIIDSSMHVDRDPMVVFDQLLNVPNTYCSYRGVVTPPIQLSSTGSADVALQVPPGGVRLVQVVGVNDSAICASGVFGGDDSGGGSGKYFEIGRGVVYDLFGDRSVEVTTSWPTAAGVQGDLDRLSRTLDCGGRCIQATGAAEDLTNYTTPIPIYSPIAQKFTVSETTYLRQVDVALSSISAAADVTLTVYSGGLAGGNTTSYSATVTAVPTTAGVVTFDLFHPTFRYLQLLPGIDYYLVFTTTQGVNFMKTTSEGSAGDVQVNSGTWSNSSANRIYTKIKACN